MGFFMGISIGFAEPKPKPKYKHLVGVKKCRICHKMKKRGNQYGKWKSLKHSRAYKILLTEKAQKIKKNAHKSGKCLKCHSTAYYFTEKRVSYKVKLKEGVSCESCHGPGKKYRKNSVMKKRKLAIAKGLIAHPEKVCTKCHNPESPTYQKFHLETFLRKIAHPVPPKK